jgi:DNA repair protein RecN (Recombination protein N)
MSASAAAWPRLSAHNCARCAIHARCCTHLAHLAQGHRHLQVTKETAANTTVTHIGPLSAKERVQEIARMLGGVEITRQTLDLAAEMLSRVGENADVPA